jgi:hypothetical protein
MVKEAIGDNSKAKKSSKIEDKLVENLVELQKVQTNLSEKFDKLSDQIGKLLTLFELAAKSFAQNPNINAVEKDAEFLNKINTLLDQNKTIAKGLTLMEERIRERVYGAPKMEEHHQELSSESMQPSPNVDKEEDVIPTFSNSNRPLPKF